MIFIIVDLSTLSSLTQESVQLTYSSLYIQHVESFRMTQMSLHILLIKINNYTGSNIKHRMPDLMHDS